MGDLIQEISKLSVSERIQLVQAILQTIELDQESGALSEAQQKMVELRSKEIREGQTPTLPWEQIKSKLAQRYGI
jgi:putative addiction module component (TIGR02574 family)